MRNIKLSGLIIIVVSALIAFLIFTSPTWYKDLTKEMKSNRVENLKLDEKEQKFRLNERKLNDSLKLIDQRKYDSLILVERHKKQLKAKQIRESKSNTYFQYYNFIDEVLAENGNAETENYLVLKKYNKKDSCNRFLIYKKIKIEKILTSNNTSVIYLNDYYEIGGNWFDHPNILPCDPFKIFEFKENYDFEFMDIINLMKNFKSEYLIKQ